MHFKFEAMDATGQEIRDTIEADNEEVAQNLVRKMGYFVTKIQSVGNDPIGSVKPVKEKGTLTIKISSTTIFNVGSSLLILIAGVIIGALFF